MELIQQLQPQSFWPRNSQTAAAMEYSMQHDDVRMDLINSCALEIVHGALAIQRTPRIHRKHFELLPDFPICSVYIQAVLSPEEAKQDGAAMILAMNDLVHDMPLNEQCTCLVSLVLSKLAKQIFSVVGLSW